jgi:hypothetical protein
MTPLRRSYEVRRVYLPLISRETAEKREISSYGSGEEEPVYAGNPILKRAGSAEYLKSGDPRRDEVMREIAETGGLYNVSDMNVVLSEGDKLIVYAILGDGRLVKEGGATVKANRPDNPAGKKAFQSFEKIAVGKSLL